MYHSKTHSSSTYRVPIKVGKCLFSASICKSSAICCVIQAQQLNTFLDNWLKYMDGGLSKVRNQCCVKISKFELSGQKGRDRKKHKQCDLIMMMHKKSLT